MSEPPDGNEWAVISLTAFLLALVLLAFAMAFWHHANAWVASALVDALKEVVR